MEFLGKPIAPVGGPTTVYLLSETTDSEASVYIEFTDIAI